MEFPRLDRKRLLRYWIYIPFNTNVDSIDYIMLKLLTGFADPFRNFIDEVNQSGQWHC